MHHKKCFFLVLVLALYAMPQTQYASASDSLEFSLREHKLYSGLTIIGTFSKPDGTTLREESAASSWGGVYIFISVPRVWLNGKYLRFRWQGYCSYPRTNVLGVYIYDGDYDRTDDVQDFPTGSFGTYGAGLLTTLIQQSNTFAMETKDFLIDTTGGVMPYCTIFWMVSDGWASSHWLQLDWVEFNSGADGSGNLYSEDFTDSIVMERTGTEGDYGRISTGSIPFSKPPYLTFYFTAGGKFLYNGTIIVNATKYEFVDNNIIRLVAAPNGNMTYGFFRFNINGSITYTNNYNYTVTANATIWCDFNEIVTGGTGETVLIGNGLTSLPLNLIMYSACTVLGIWLMTRKDRNIKYICKILASFLFVYLALWISQDILLDTQVFYINAYSGGTYTYTYSLQHNALPFTVLIFEFINLMLAIVPVLLIYLDRQT